jgi:hypothetical protein
MDSIHDRMRKDLLQEQRVKEFKALRRAEDREMILNCAMWPLWPQLPVKRPSSRPGHMPELGTIKATDMKPVLDQFVVQIGGGIYAPKDEPTTTVHYHTVDELLDAGWTVD